VAAANRVVNRAIDHKAHAVLRERHNRCSSSGVTECASQGYIARPAYKRAFDAQLAVFTGKLPTS
jgi:hypothetical protein